MKLVESTASSGFHAYMHFGLFPFYFSLLLGLGFLISSFSAAIDEDIFVLSLWHACFCIVVWIQHEFNFLDMKIEYLQRSFLRVLVDEELCIGGATITGIAHYLRIKCPVWSYGNYLEFGLTGEFILYSCYETAFLFLSHSFATPISRISKVWNTVVNCPWPMFAGSKGLSRAY